VPVPGGTSLTLLSQCRDEAQLGASWRKSKMQSAGQAMTEADQKPRLPINGKFHRYSGFRKLSKACNSA
jgi:hypothetical protein